MNDSAHDVDVFSELIMMSAVASRHPDNQEAATEALEELFGGWTLTACPAFFHADPSQYVGFVSAVVRNKTVYVPIHLVDLFPTQKNLEELVDRAQEVRAMTNSTICLSGSQVFGINSAVDTDYCEYVPHTGQRLAGSFIELSRLRSSLCVIARHSGTTLTGPDDVLMKVMSICQTDSGFLRGACTCKSRYWKFDYLCPTPTGPIVATNVCVHEEDCEKHSWAYQEAAITAAGQPVRQLADPLQLGEYLKWLRNIIEECSLDQPLKGLKRALSLCKLLLLKQSSSSLVEFLNSPDAVQFAESNVKRDIAELQQYLPPDKQNDTPAPVSGCGDNVAKHRFRAEASSILSSVIEQYDNLLQHVERRLGYAPTASKRTQGLH